MSQPERSIFDELDEIDPDMDARRLAEARADVAAGRVISNEEVIRWLKTWGTPDYRPINKPWAK